MQHNTSDQGKWKMIKKWHIYWFRIYHSMKPCWMMMMMMEKNIKHPEEKKGKRMFFWTYRKRIWGLVMCVPISWLMLELMQPLLLYRGKNHTHFTQHNFSRIECAMQPLALNHGQEFLVCRERKSTLVSYLHVFVSAFSLV